MKKILIIAALLAITLPVFADEYPYGFPAAGTITADTIPIEQVRRIALAEAEDAWGTVTPGPEIPSCDIYGNINAYICVFKIGTGKFESFAKIMQAVQEGRRMCDETLALGHGRKSAKYMQGKKKKWGEGSYGTVVVSARTCFFPVAERIHGLPPFYTVLDLIAPAGAKLTRIFYISPMEQYYEFNGKNLMNALSLKTVRSLPVPKQGKDSNDGMKERVKKAWKKHGL